MTYDCFTFFNELDLLEIRLNTLNDVVDRFVIAEATRTFRGQPKELLFEKNRSRFAAFADKIDYIVVDDLLPSEEIEKNPYELAWINESRQRNALKRGLSAARPQDIVLLSDLDEIPRPEAVARLDDLLHGETRGVRFEMAFYYYFVNFKNYSSPVWKQGTFAARCAIFEDKAYLSQPKCGRFMPESENHGATMQRLRSMPNECAMCLPNAGWHFSYLGGIEAIDKKLKSFSHSEFSTIPRTVLEECIRRGRDPFGRGERYFADPIDETFPKCIRENQSKFASLIFPVSKRYLRSTAWARWMARRNVSSQELLEKGCLFMKRILSALRRRIVKLLLRRDTAAEDETYDIFDFNLQPGRDQMAAYNEIFGEGWKPVKKPGMVGAVFIMTERYFSMLKAAFDQPNLYFHVLVIPFEQLSIPIVKELLTKNRDRIEHVYEDCPNSYEAFFQTTGSDYDLSFDEIRQYVASHYKAQRMLTRHIRDMPESDYRFIHSLRFWLGVFRQNDIRLVFSNTTEHGYCGDSLVYEIAVRHHVPVYLAAIELANSHNCVCSFRRIDETGYHQCSLQGILPPADLGVDLRQFVHAPDAANRSDLTEKEKASLSLAMSGRHISNILHWFEKERESLSERDRFKVETAYFGSCLMRDPRQTYRDWQQVCDLKNAYEAISERPRPGEKYVFYALHLEPEASINNRGLISSQLWVVKSLAEALPDGYKLYVKEHPMQFSVADTAHADMFHMSHNMEWFRSKQFYAEILRLPNVRLIAVDEDSNGLIERAQAVATICGTVALEAIVHRKPLLVFSDETSLVSRTKDVFRVHSMGEVKEALRQVASGFVPDYSDINEVASDNLVEIRSYGGLEIDEDQRRKFAAIIKWATEKGSRASC